MSSPANVLLILVVIAWVLARQLSTAPVKIRLLVAVPVVLAYVGLQQLPSSVSPDPVDVGLIGASMLGSLLLGWWRGLTMQVWATEDGVWMRRGTWVTMTLWGLLLVLRGVIAVIGYAVGHPHSSGASVLLCCLALSVAAQNGVTLLRVNGLRPSLLPATMVSPAMTGQ